MTEQRNFDLDRKSDSFFDSQPQHRLHDQSHKKYASHYKDYTKLDRHSVGSKYNQSASCDVVHSKMDSATSQEQYKSFASLGVGFMGLVGETLLSHPCVVLRRQCQVRQELATYHLFPFSLIPVIYNIHKLQGVTCLWKGIGSVFIVRGLSLVTENVLSEVTYFPREVNRHSSAKKLIQHICLKALNLAILTPFYASSFVETVQSDIASDSPGVLDCVKDGARRYLIWSSPNSSSNLLPWYKLVPSMVSLGLSIYIIRGITTYVMLRHQDEDEEASSSSFDHVYSELMTTFMGSLLSDCLVYPLETLTHRLFVQGTRVLIDNLDSGVGVTAVGSVYTGPVNALFTIIREESLFGLYKGFGALVIQFSIHLLLLRATKVCYNRLTESWSSVGPYESDLTTTHDYESSDDSRHSSHRSPILLSDNEDFSESFDR